MSDSSYQLDVLCVGELLIDFISYDRAESLSYAGCFQPYVGGQAANVAQNVARLGGRAAIVSRVGADGFGLRCIEALNAVGVDTRWVQTDPNSATTMAVIARSAATPDFMICRGADRRLRPSDLPEELVASTRALHASAFGLSHEPSRSVILSALSRAKQAGALVSLDPTYHPRVWGTEQDPLPILQEAYRHVAVTKPSLDDCHRLFGAGYTPEAYAERFLAMGPEIVVLTMGAEGALLATADGLLHRLPSRPVEVADVTGAGDAFWSGLLMALLRGLPAPQAVRVGMEVAAIKVQQIGPLRSEIDLATIMERAGLFR